MAALLIGAPAATAVWSGWVGLGQLSGFGIIHPLPGIWNNARLNTAITLPVGVEANAADALGAWLTPGTSDRARRFARWSAIGSLGLGMAGQVAYHLLAAAHATRAPWPVVTLVSCLPVVALAFGAALAHLLHAGSEAPQDVPATETVGLRRYRPGSSRRPGPGPPGLPPGRSAGAGAGSTATGSGGPYRPQWWYWAISAAGSGAGGWAGTPARCGFLIVTAASRPPAADTPAAMNTAVRKLAESAAGCR